MVNIRKTPQIPLYSLSKTFVNENFELIGERILLSNKNAISIKEKMVFPKTSIGISIYPHDGDSIETLINNADKAMYYAKESGKNQYSFYNSKI